MRRTALIVHGGAGAQAPDLRGAQGAGCSAAIAAGWRVLSGGGSAIDAVCAAVRVLEDDPAFNAGVGSALTSAGTVEMDASVMDGARLTPGAVAVVRSIRNPVLAARALMEDGRHVMLAGPDADAFAASRGLETCRPEDLITTRQVDRWQKLGNAGAGTVGAAALDLDGHVAAATSTGGLMGKLPGRVGDSAIIGAGTYADDWLGAVSATGNGEAILRIGLARSVVDMLATGVAPDTAAGAGIVRLERRVAGRGGIVVIDRLGRTGWAHNTAQMSVGYMHCDLDAPVIRV
jgi:beta-aspartyl-peptidase (threonine type)